MEPLKIKFVDPDDPEAIKELEKKYDVLDSAGITIHMVKDKGGTNIGHIEDVNGDSLLVYLFCAQKMTEFLEEYMEQQREKGNLDQDEEINVGLTISQMKQWKVDIMNNLASQHGFVEKDDNDG